LSRGPSFRSKRFGPGSGLTDFAGNAVAITTLNDGSITLSSEGGTAVVPEPSKLALLGMAGWRHPGRVAMASPGPQSGRKSFPGSFYGDCIEKCRTAQDRLA
jgi:hypothetical protein